MVVEWRKSNWYQHNDEVVMFASDMLRSGYFAPVGTKETSTEAENLLSYFEKPYHYTREHTWWVVNGWTDDSELWEVGLDTEFDPAPKWVINADDPNDDGLYLYWLVDYGWVELPEASVFDAAERTCVIEGHWEALSTANVGVSE